MGLRFITPETIRLPISGGESIVIKKRLTAGERDEMMSSMAPRMTPGQEMQIDTKSMRALKIAAYLIGWSSPVAMSPDLPVQVRVDTLNGLDPDDFDDIERVIDAHVSQQVASKNGQGGAPASAPTSASGAL